MSYIEHKPSYSKSETDTIVKKSIGTIKVYTDGSFRKEKIGDVCGFGIYFPGGELKNIASPFTQEPLTNNRAELYAIYRAIRLVEKNFEFDRLVINTDSEYSLKAVTVWIHNWKKRGWKNVKNKPVENQDLIKKIDALLTSHPNKIEIKWVKAHAGDKGNEKADSLANRGADIFRDRYLTYNKA